MLTIDLRSLKPQELARLLDIAKGRGEDELARMVSAELAARHRLQEPDELAGNLPASLDASGTEPASAGAWRGLAMVAGVAALAFGVGWALNSGQRRPSPTSLEQATAIASPSPGERPAIALASLPAPAATRAPERAPATRSNPCLALPTPGERLVCGYPTLAARHRKLEAALARARAIGADPAEIEAAQAAWMRDRDRTRDRKRLAALYDARLGEIEAAARAPDEDAPS